MNNGQVTLIEEPSLEFADKRLAVTPQDGLALYGAYESTSSRPLMQTRYIVIGAPEGLNLWHLWSEVFNWQHIASKYDLRLWPPYPGYDVAFGYPWPKKDIRSYTLDREALLIASRKGDIHERCFAVVEIILKHFESSQKLDIKPSVAICVVPDEIFQNCRPESMVSTPTSPRISSRTKKMRQKGQLDLFEQVNIDQYLLAPDFRRQLKARTMKFDLPVQIIRESTLRLSDENKFGQRPLTPISDRMWNLGTALYYKSGGKPWKLSTARKGVCYVGLAFRRVPSEGKQSTACCAAQMFVDSGDGIVFVGEPGPFYSPETNQFHLTKKSAQELLTGVLKTYQDLKAADDPQIEEVFLHSRSEINKEEFAGYWSALSSDCKLVGIRVRRDRIGNRLFRHGRMPVMRGTYWVVNNSSAFLFATGYKPRIATYDGWETPVPLQIDIQHGEADIYEVGKDILSLTKLNYNACKIGEGQPVTVLFSDAVGEILISNPTIKKGDRRHSFKYYI